MSEELKQQKQPDLKQILQNKSQLYTKLWPYEQEQKAKSQLFITRLKAWPKVFSRIENYFGAQKYAHELMARETQTLMKLFKDIEGTALEEQDSTHLNEIVDSAAKKHALTAQNVKTQLIKAVQDLQNNHQKQIKTFQHEITHKLNEMKKQRHDTLTLLSDHLHHFQQVKINQTSDAQSVDPWLTEQAVTTQIRNMVHHENLSRADLRQMQNDIRAYESHVIHSLFQLVSLYCSVEVVHTQEMQRILSAFGTTSPQMESGSLFDAYSARLKLMDADCFNTGLTADDFDYPLPSSESEGIQLEAIFLRPGTYRKSVYRPSLFVLTINGFLHCYRMEHSAENTDVVKADPQRILYSIYLRTPKMEIIHSLQNINCIELSVPQPTLLNSKKTHTYLLKTESSEQMLQWLEAMQQYLLVNRDRPEIEE